MPSPPLPLVGVMIGDPAGIGPEVCARAVASGELAQLCRVVLIGDVAVMERAAGVCNLELDFVPINDPIDAPDGGAVGVLDPGTFDIARSQFGTASAQAGEAVLQWLGMGEQLGREGKLQALVLGPMETASMKATGKVHDMDDLQPAGTFMLRMSGSLRVVPLTEHVPLSTAIEMVTPERVLHVVRLVHRTLISWGFTRPRIAVAGINPHAMFPEDQSKIAPAVATAREEGVEVQGPLVPDTVFRHAIEGRHDVVVTMFHDQGQIPVKTSAFEGACTVYIGLPFVMLNVPHGTAYDIAGKGVAQHLSMLSAIRTAAGLAAGKPIAP
jgi:4-phospho-D-threonate 3-dehydrogenase / 4-phospho-D-erythronate 3-dehydrogenase